MWSSGIGVMPSILRKDVQQVVTPVRDGSGVTSGLNMPTVVRRSGTAARFYSPQRQATDEGDHSDRRIHSNGARTVSQERSASFFGLRVANNRLRQ